jgi:hypothetical protein
MDSEHGPEKTSPAATGEPSDVLYREVETEASDDSSLGSMLAASAVSAGAAYTKMLGTVVGAGWRRTSESPPGRLVRSMIHGAVEAAARESAPFRAAAGEWSQAQLSRLSSVLVPVIMDSIDVDAVVAGIDSERLARELGASIADQLDLNAILADVDVDGILERVDVEALVERIDVEAITRRIRFGALVVESTGEAAGTAIGVARRQAAGTNDAIFRSMGRLLGRRPDEEGEDEPDTGELDEDAQDLEEEDLVVDLGDVEEVESVGEVDSA